uniref:Fcr2 n=1 Tax=Arundo donax TaxID=35708 RepID=A0A0A9FSX9_ARUDO
MMRHSSLGIHLYNKLKVSNIRVQSSSVVGV